MKKIEAVKELSKACDVESDEEPDEVPNDDVSDESVSRWALRRAALRAGIITGRNPNVLFLAVVRIRLRTTGEAVMTGVSVSQASGAVAIYVDGAGGIGVTGTSVDGVVVSGDDDPDGDDGRDMTLALHLETIALKGPSDTCLSSNSSVSSDSESDSYSSEHKNGETASNSCAVGRSVGKIGILPLTTLEPAKHSSNNHVAGILETKPILSVTKDVTRSWLIQKVLPAIRAKWTQGHTCLIYIQQDNTKPHIGVEDAEFLREASRDGFDIWIRF
ncbi:hypothetical protein Tco_0669900 [Tanacetum coccineum]